MVSIIICFYERLEHLKRCLDSLSFSSGSFDEVIITDDGSREDVVRRLKEMITHYDFSIHHVWQPNRGFRAAAARNTGIRHAKGDYLLFFDSDFLILPGTVDCHVNLARQGRFVAGNCKYLTEDQTTALFNGRISPEGLESVYSQIPEREMIKDHRRFIKRTILFRLHLLSYRKQSLGGHLSIHRRDINQVNGYDENFVGWGGEDEDLAMRLVKAGIYGRSAIRSARVLHMLHPKEIGDKHWKEGPNIDYFRRSEVPTYCDNGLYKA